jgi:16S rRNA (guanine966-N2)-methyltransferase
MRIIAGEWRGRPLKAPPGMATRPTADRVRETLFSMLASRLGPSRACASRTCSPAAERWARSALSRGAATLR